MRVCVYHLALGSIVQQRHAFLLHCGGMPTCNVSLCSKMALRHVGSMMFASQVFLHVTSEKLQVIVAKIAASNEQDSTELD